MLSFHRWPRWGFVTIALAVVLVVGGIDYVTGHEILLSTFYLLAVALAAWKVGPGFAIAISLLSVGAWVAGDLAAGATYPRAFVPVWNAAIILAFYLIVILLLDRLRGMQRGLEERVRMRTVALTEEMQERERLEREILDVGERERRRIGRDLHDSLGQLLTGTALAGQVLQERLEARTAPETKDAANIVGLVEDAIELTRRFARGLDPVEIEAGGLTQGLRELADQTSALSPTRCAFHEDAPVAIADSATATHLYRIAQEAVSNAIKHAHASCIEVRLDAPEGRIRLSVRDDGAGLPPTAWHRAGMGLRVMAHRAAVMGGTFSAGAEANGGTMVVCEVPDHDSNGRQE